MSPKVYINTVIVDELGKPNVLSTERQSISSTLHLGATRNLYIEPGQKNTPKSEGISVMEMIGSYNEEKVVHGLIREDADLGNGQLPQLSDTEKPMWTSQV